MIGLIPSSHSRHGRVGCLASPRRGLVLLARAVTSAAPPRRHEKARPFPPMVARKTGPFGIRCVNELITSKGGGQGSLLL